MLYRKPSLRFPALGCAPAGSQQHPTAPRPEQPKLKQPRRVAAPKATQLRLLRRLLLALQAWPKQPGSAAAAAKKKKKMSLRLACETTINLLTSESKILAYKSTTTTTTSFDEPTFQD